MRYRSSDRSRRCVTVQMAALAWFVLGSAGCTLDGFMFGGTPHDGPYDFSDSTIPADKFTDKGTDVLLPFGPSRDG